MRSLIQFIILGLGSGATYALFAQGAVLIYRGSGLVNFAQGALGMFAAYFGFLELKEKHDLPTVVSLTLAVLAAGLVSYVFQMIVLRRLRRAAAIVRVISTIGLLALIQSIVEKRFGAANRPIEQYLPHRVFNVGGVFIQEERIYIVAISVLVTAALWAWTRFTRVGLAINASAQNERAVQTLGWSPDRLAGLTWALGGALAGLAAVLVAPLTGLSPSTFTLVVTISGLGAALLGGFHSFPVTFIGGLIIGLTESLATRYKGDVQNWLNQSQITGLNRAPAFIAILLVLVVRGRGLPLRSHIADRLPKLGSGVLNLRGLVLSALIVLALLFGVMDESWARATFVSLSVGVMILSIVVLTGFAGQLSLGQYAIAGIAALIAGKFVHGGMTPELAILLSVVMTIPIGLLFALPALRTRGVNLAVVTLGLGYTVSEVVFANANYLGPPIDGGTNIGLIKLFGIEVDAFSHPHRWAVVCLIAFVLVSLVVANLRRSDTGRRLIAVRTNERAAASLGISVFTVKLFSFAVAAGIAAIGGILIGFRSQNIQYGGFNVFESISIVGFAVTGGIGFVLAGVFASPNASGGLGTRVIEDWIGLENRWDVIFGGVLVLVILIVQQDGIAAAVTDHAKPLLQKLRLVGKKTPVLTLPELNIERVPPRTLVIAELTVRFGGVTAVDAASFEVRPGEVVGLIGPNGAGKTTIIDAVSGFVKPSFGGLSIDAQEVNTWSASRRARAGLRRSFQSLELFEDLTVEANIRAGADVSRHSRWLTDLFWPHKQDLSSASVAAIREFNLVDELDKFPGQLSYGRRRLVGIARSVASGPSLLMLDEPAAGLDEVESKELARLVRRLASDWGMGVLLVEHDVGLVMSTCDRIVVIEFGRVIATGTPAEIRVNARVKAAYLGDDSDEEAGVSA